MFRNLLAAKWHPEYFNAPKQRADTRNKEKNESPSHAAARFGDAFFVRMDFVISFILPSGLLPSAK